MTRPPLQRVSVERYRATGSVKQDFSFDVRAETGCRAVAIRLLVLQKHCQLALIALLLCWRLHNLGFIAIAVAGSCCNSESQAAQLGLGATLIFL